MERNLYLTLLLKELGIPWRDCPELQRYSPQKTPPPGHSKTEPDPGLYSYQYRRYQGDRGA